jgi:hypothetical protein
MSNWAPVPVAKLKTPTQAAAPRRQSRIPESFPHRPKHTRSFRSFHHYYRKLAFPPLL